jgi:hypothetical protein
MAKSDFWDMHQRDLFACCDSVALQDQKQKTKNKAQVCQTCAFVLPRLD